MTNITSKQLPEWTDRFSKIIKNTRTKLKETGTEFGKRFGVTHASVSDWERGVSEAPYRVIGFCLAHDTLTSQELQHLQEKRDIEWLLAMEKVPLFASGFAGDNINIHELCEVMGYTKEKIEQVLAQNKKEENEL